MARLWRYRIGGSDTLAAEKVAGFWDAEAVVACKPRAVNRTKKKYLWSWAIAGVVIPLLLLLLGLFMPKPPGWDPFQEPKISPAQHRFAVVATMLWPTAVAAEVLALVVTDAGGDSGAALPSAILIGISLLLNAAIYVGIGLILWTFGEVFSRFFQRRSPS